MQAYWTMDKIGRIGRIGRIGQNWTDWTNYKPALHVASDDRSFNSRFN